jgi:nitrate reductase gamma subunit
VVVAALGIGVIGTILVVMAILFLWRRRWNRQVTTLSFEGRATLLPQRSEVIECTD